MGWKFEPEEPRFTPMQQSMQDPVAMLENYISGAEKIKKLLKEEKKDDKKDERKGKSYSALDVTCLSIIFMITSPWTGQLMIKAFKSAMLTYGIPF